MLFAKRECAVKPSPVIVIVEDVQPEMIDFPARAGVQGPQLQPDDEHHVPPDAERSHSVFHRRTPLLFAGPGITVRNRVDQYLVFQPRLSSYDSAIRARCSHPAPGWLAPQHLARVEIEAQQIQRDVRLDTLIGIRPGGEQFA